MRPYHEQEFQSFSLLFGQVLLVTSFDSTAFDAWDAAWAPQAHHKYYRHPNGQQLMAGIGYH